MKKLFLSLALMLTVSLTFATNEEAKVLPITIEKTISTADSEMITPSSSIENIEIIKAEFDWEFPVFWEDEFGSGGFTMSGNGSMSDILNALLDVFFP